MNLSGNTILVTGGNSGIGRGLAEALHKAGNEVIITGRNQATLDETIAANPGMKAMVLDVESAEAIKEFAAQMTSQYPTLNVVINNAGIMRSEKLLEIGEDVPDALATITTNLLGPIRLTSALLPHLQKQPSATLMTVSSGLAFVPLAMTPTYCATKAAIHSYSQSLRWQLKDTSIEVLKLVPPAVATELMPGHSENPNAMPLDAFINEVMEILKDVPASGEICVQSVNPLRFAVENGNYDQIFSHLNQFHPQPAAAK